MAAPSVFVYFHTHWDREWYDPFRLYQVRLAEVVDDILLRLEDGLFPCFMLDGQTVLLEDYIALRPENEQRLINAIQSGKLSIGPWYVMPDEFLVSGESLIRNLQKGIQISRNWLGKKAKNASFTGYLPDTFGHSADIPMILSQCDIHSAVVWRGVNPPHAEFTWESPSGDHVHTLHLTDGYFQMHLTDIDLSDSQRVEAIKTLVDKLAAQSGDGRVLVPIGGDHLGAADRHACDLLTEAVKKYHVTTPAEFLDKPSKKNLAVIQNELLDNSSTFVLQGVWSSRMYLKQRNRWLEHVLTRQLEPMIAMTQLLAKTPVRYPKQELETAWTLLLQNHPHDSICGCSVDSVHRQNEVRFDEVEELTDAMLHRQWGALLNDLQVGNDYWLVVNTGDAPYTGVVSVTEDHTETRSVKINLLQLADKTSVLLDAYHNDTHQVPLAHKTVSRKTGWIWVDDIPAHGYKVISKSQRVLPKQMANATENSLDNEFFTVTCESGTLTVLVKATGEVFSGMHRIVDQSEQGDSYNGAPVPGQPEQVAEFKHCKQVLSGPLVSELALTYQLGKMQIVTHVRVKAGLPQLQFETRFVNGVEDHKLQVCFEAKAPITEVFAESHFSWLSRTYDPGFDLSQAMPADKFKEIRPNTGPIQRCLAFEHQGLITEGLTEYEISGQTLKLTLFRGFGMLSKADTGVRGAQAGPPLPTPEGQCLGRPLVCRYAWTPVHDPQTAFSMLHGASDAFYGVVLGREGQAPEGTPAQPNQLVTWDNPAIVSTACAWSAEGPGLLLRLMNTTNKPQKLALKPEFQCKPAMPVNFIGEPVDASDDVSLKPFGVQTFLFCVK